MASRTLTDGAQHEWLLANPWPWLFLGLGLCLTNWAAVVVFGASLNGVGLTLVCLGLLATGAGVTIRLSSSSPAFLNQLATNLRNVVLLGLALLLTLSALTLTGLLVFRCFDINPAGLRWNGVLILWIIVGPLSVAAAMCCVQHARPGAALTPAEEGAGVLLVAALTVFCACRALYNADSPEDWDSLRLFLAVVFVVALGAAPLLVVSQALRRLVVSVLLLLHFVGIGTAVMSAPPSPWVVQQLWGRVYQPYLEFMYLNNAYHFYAPEPGPASYLWLRMYYEDPDKKLWAHWVKIPEIDEKGWHKNTLALEYQRMLALTENVVPADAMPGMYRTLPDGTAVYAEWYARRIEHSPNQINAQPVVGKIVPEVHGLLVPYPLFIPLPQQFQQPNANSRALLAAYARHACLAEHPTHKDWKIHSVKIYRVVHFIPEINTFVNERMDPRDPVNYRPYYMGRYNAKGDILDMNKYDSQGKLIEPGDPFLFWLLPMLRDPPTYVLKSPIKSWVARHAGDPDWIYTYDETQKRHLTEEEANVLNRPIVGSRR